MRNTKRFRGLTGAQARDFAAYCRLISEIKIGEPKSIDEDVVAGSLAHWFWLWDTHGVRARYRDQQLCWRLVQAKAHLNLTINLWIEDLLRCDLVLGADEVLGYCSRLPKWVERSLRNAFAKQVEGRYIPSFYDLSKHRL